MVITYDVGFVADKPTDAGTVLQWNYLDCGQACAFTTGPSDCVWLVPGTYEGD